MKKLILFAIVSAFFGLSGNAQAYLLVEDIPNLTTNIINEIKNYAQMIQQTLNQVTQIENQVTQIENQVTQLARFGSPDYYVNLLGLNQFLAASAAMVNGLGNTIAAYRQAADGGAALGYTANGLYANLTNTIDRFGNPVQVNPQNFTKFATIQNMVEGYNAQQHLYNTQNTSFLGQMTTALQKLNADNELVGTVKYGAQINGIHGQITTNNANSVLAGQGLLAQQISNQNDAARVLEFRTEEMIQERVEDVQNLANQFSLLMGGPVNPLTPPNPALLP